VGLEFLQQKHVLQYRCTIEVLPTPVSPFIKILARKSGSLDMDLKLVSADMIFLLIL